VGLDSGRGVNLHPAKSRSSAARARSAGKPVCRVGTRGEDMRAATNSSSTNPSRSNMMGSSSLRAVGRGLSKRGVMSANIFQLDLGIKFSHVNF
jgi:hypothetical protein